MKKFDFIKTLQLIIFTVFASACVAMALSDKELYHTIANNPDVKLICGLLWACFILSFIFIFLDFYFISSNKNDYRELKHAVHSDHVAGIANRNSCDEIIQKYLDKPLPEGIGSVMFDLTNMTEINRTLGYIQGNAVIRDFSNILKMSSVSLCFVGRNGGNKFLAIFENSSKDNIDLFLSRIQTKINMYNKNNPERSIRYKYGVAFNEDTNVKTITDLVALSNRRIYEES